MCFIEEPLIADESPIRPGETLSEFYSRSSKEHAQEARKVINCVACLVDGSVRQILRSRFTSSDNREFLSAFSETAAYLMMRGLGHEVHFVSDHEQYQGLTPDLLVKPPGHDAFLVEVVSVYDPAESEPSRDARLNDLRRAIASVDTPRFTYLVSINGAPTRTPSQALIRRKIEKWAEGFDYDEMLANRPTIDESPTKEFRIDESCTLRLFARAILPENISPAFRKIGGEIPGDMIEFNTPVAIRKAVKKKLCKYNRLDLPFVVWVNTLSGFVEDNEFLEAAIGDVKYQRSREAETGREAWYPIFEQNGCWLSKKGPLYRNNSGLVAVHNLTPSTLLQSRAMFLNNPWALQDLGPHFSAMTQIRIGSPATHKISVRSAAGVSLAELVYKGADLAR